MSPEATKSNCLVLLSFLLSQIGLQIEFVRCLFACFRGAGKEMKERENQDKRNSGSLDFQLLSCKHLVSQSYFRV